MVIQHFYALSPRGQDKRDSTFGDDGGGQAGVARGDEGHHGGIDNIQVLGAEDSQVLIYHRANGIGSCHVIGGLGIGSDPSRQVGTCGRRDPRSETGGHGAGSHEGLSELNGVGESLDVASGAGVAVGLEGRFQGITRGKSNGASGLGIHQEDCQFEEIDSVFGGQGGKGVLDVRPVVYRNVRVDESGDLGAWSEDPQSRFGSSEGAEVDIRESDGVVVLESLTHRQIRHQLNTEILDLGSGTHTRSQQEICGSESSRRYNHTFRSLGLLARSVCNETYSLSLRGNATISVNIVEDDASSSGLERDIDEVRIYSIEISKEGRISDGESAGTNCRCNREVTEPFAGISGNIVQIGVDEGSSTTASKECNGYSGHDGGRQQGQPRLQASKCRGDLGGEIPGRLRKSSPPILSSEVRYRAIYHSSSTFHGSD